MRDRCLYCGALLVPIEGVGYCVTCDHLKPTVTELPLVMQSESAKGAPRRPGPIVPIQPATAIQGRGTGVE